MNTPTAENPDPSHLTSDELRLLKLTGLATGQSAHEVLRAAIERYADEIASGGPRVIDAQTTRNSQLVAVTPTSITEQHGKQSTHLSKTDPDTPSGDSEVEAGSQQDNDHTSRRTRLTFDDGDDVIAEAALSLVQGQPDATRYTCRDLAQAINFHSAPTAKRDRPSVSMYQWLSHRMGVPLRRSEQQGQPRYVTAFDLRDCLTPCPPDENEQ